MITIIIVIKVLNLKNKFSEFNLFYKYLVQKRVVVINKRK